MPKRAESSAFAQFSHNVGLLNGSLLPAATAFRSKESLAFAFFFSALHFGFGKTVANLHRSGESSPGAQLIKSD